MKKGSFQLHKWQSNSSEILLELQKEGIVSFNSDDKKGQDKHGIRYSIGSTERYFVTWYFTCDKGQFKRDD